MNAEGAAIVQAAAGQILYTDDGVVLEVLAPFEKLPAGASSDPNRASVVLRLTYGQRPAYVHVRWAPMVDAASQGQTERAYHLTRG